MRWSHVIAFLLVADRLFLPALSSWDAAWQQEDEQNGAMLVALGLGSVGDGNANSEIGNTQKTLASPERRWKNP
jgi:hypothetical protein